MSTKIVRSKSTDETSSTTPNVTPPRKQASVSEPLHNARMLFLQSHIDLDTSYNSGMSSTKCNARLSNDSYSDDKDSQCTRTEKGLLRRFMHVQ